MKNKIVEHIANNARNELQGAIGEYKNMRDRYPELGQTSAGIGLDFQVMREKLNAALKLIELLV